MTQARWMLLLLVTMWSLFVVTCVMDWPGVLPVLTAALYTTYLYRKEVPR